MSTKFPRGLLGKLRPLFGSPNILRKTDWKILESVENDSGITDSHLATKIGMAIGALTKRIESLEDQGFLRLEWTTKAGLKICGLYPTTKGLELIKDRR